MRTKLLPCILLVATACVEPTASTRQPVIGGTPTPAGLYPATGALVAEVNGTRQVFCTGTLIAPDAVLTAAHCMIAPPYIGTFTPEFTLALDANTATDAEIYTSSAHYSHPMFDPNTSPPGTLSHSYDIALVLFQDPIPGAMPAYLPTDAESAALVAGIPLEITGYGQTSASDQTHGVKYNATTTMVALGDWEIQVGEAGMPQNCHGDSGGPAYIHEGSDLRLLGIVSRGLSGGEDTCNIGGIDTRADMYKSWIETYVPLMDPPSDTGSGSGSGMGSGSGSDPGMSEDPGEPSPGHGGGCSAAGGGSLGLVVVLALALARVRRR